MIRIEDTKKVEKYTKSKFLQTIDIIDLEAWSMFIKVAMILRIKCIYSFNHHRSSDITINEDMVSNGYPRYSKIEIWNHVVKYKEIALF